MKTPEEIAEGMVDEYMLCSRDSLLYKEEIISPIATAIQAERDRAAVLERALEIYANPSEFNDDGDGGWSARQALAEYRKDREV